MDDSPIIDAFMNMQVPLMIVGPEGRVSHCNQATARMFGYSCADLAGRSICDILPVASLEELNGFIKPPAIDVLVKGMIGRQKSGDPVLLAAQITAWTDGQLGLQHALALRDITDEMEAERQAQEKLKLADNAIKGARIGVFQYDAITDTMIVSEICRALLGLAPTDDVDVQQEWRERVHPDDLDAAMEAMRLCLKDVRERTSCEYRFRPQAGSRWRWMRADLAIAKRDVSGDVIRVIGALTDISEHKAIENALRVSADQFRSAFDNASVGMAIVGLDGSWLRANTALCDLLGYTEDDLLMTDFQSVTHPEDLDADLDFLDQLVKGQIPSYQMQKRYIRANGAVMWGLLSVGMIKNADGEPEHFISQIVDVSQQRRMSELQSEFVSTVSHELRTPLTSVLGSLSLLSTMDTEPLSDEAQRLLYIAQQNGERLNSLVNDILEFEKFSTRKMHLTLTRQRIAELVEEAVLTNLASADRYGVRFHADFPHRTLSGWVDPKRFQQVMTNLLSNAAKFADKGSTIDVATEQQKNAVRISVSNLGAGIPDAFRDQIFQPFSQAAPTSTRSRGGTGLGLSIAKQIVEQAGGEIGFDSVPNGKTTFWFTVPIEEPTGNQVM